jgi:PKD repeat protein
MPSFTLYDLNPDFWARVQAKAAAEGTTVKAVILRLLTAWLGVIALLLLSSGCAYHNPTGPTATVTPVPAPTPAPIAPLPAIAWDLSISASPQPVVVGQSIFVSTTITGHVAPAPVAYHWTITGQADQAGAAQIALTFGTTGPVTIAVDATDGTGHTVSAHVSLVVGLAPPPPPGPPPAPTPAPAQFAVTLGCTAAGHVTSCNVSATFGSDVLTSQVSSLDVDWGDGQAIEHFTSALATHTYAQPGSYTIIATVTAGTHTGSATKAIVIL